MNAVHVGDHRVFCVNAFDMPMYVDGRDISLAPHIMRGAIWEAHMTNLVTKLLDPGMTFVDVGANFGWFSLLAASRVGPQGRVTSWQKAAWHEKAELDFHVMRKHKGSASLRQEVQDSARAFHDDTETIRVQALTVDDMIPADLDVHLVKVDAEGAEPNVLRGMRRTIERNKDLCVSIEFAACWYPNGGAKTFLEEIEGYGFKIRKIGPNSQLLEANHQALISMAHNDLLLVPGDMDI